MSTSLFLGLNFPQKDWDGKLALVDAGERSMSRGGVGIKSGSKSHNPKRTPFGKLNHDQNTRQLSIENESARIVLITGSRLFARQCVANGDLSSYPDINGARIGSSPSSDAPRW